MKQKITLNGAWELQYQGREAEEIILPGAVETVMEKRDFYGPFYFKKKIYIEHLPQDGRAAVRFEGVSYACSVYCNGRKICDHEGIWDGFWADLTNAVNIGENILEVKVIKPDFDKESPYFFRSVLFGFIPDVMLPFGGIWKDVTLYLTQGPYIESMVPRFCAESREIIFSGRISGTEEREGFRLRLALEAPDGHMTESEEDFSETGTAFFVESCQCWSPDHPARYRGTVYLTKDEQILDQQEFSGGFRCITVENGEICLNGEPFYMRGVLHWGCYPEKMAPNPGYEEVKAELLNIKKLGFNTVKHCLYFPPAYYYELCDELGIVTWQELPLWLPYPNQWLEERIMNQYPKMLDYFMQYPSVSVVSIGCELDATIGGTMLNRLYEMIKSRERQIVICDNSGSGECFEGEKDASSDIYDYHFYAELYELNELIREFTSETREQKPWLFGEFNDFDTMRVLEDTGEKDRWWKNPDESCNLLRKVHKGFGSDQPVYRQKEILEEYGVAREIGPMEESSIEQMKEVRKFILETARSCPAVKGYNITTIQDVPITAAGILDAGGKPKVTEEFMKQINGEIVVSFQKDLARIWEAGADRFYNKDRFHYIQGQRINGRLVLSNRSRDKIQAEAEIRLKLDGRTVQTTRLSVCVEAFRTREMPGMNLTIPKGERPCRYELEVCIPLKHGVYRNQWDIWGYPDQRIRRSVYLIDSGEQWKGIENLFQVNRILERKELEELKQGDILLASSFEKDVRNAADRGINVICIVKEEGFLPVTEAPFYREGVTKLAAHPVLDSLCHRGYAGIQFFGLASGRIFDKQELEQAVGSYKTLIRRYDARKFHVGEYLAEFTWGKGTVFASTLNFGGGAGEQPHRFCDNYLAVWLLHEMITYLGEDHNEK